MPSVFQTNGLDTPFAELSGGSYDPTRKFKEEEPIDPYDFGLHDELDHLMPGYYHSWADRDDGVLNPFLGKKPNELTLHYHYPDEKDRFASDVASQESLFSSDAYAYVPSVHWYLDVSHLEQGFYPCFYDGWPEEYRTSGVLPGVWLDGIYSHGVWSY